MTGSQRLAGRGGEAEGDATAGVGRRSAAWLSRELSAERDRWALWLPVAFGAGAALYFSLPSEPQSFAAPLGLLAAAVAGFALRRRGSLVILALAAAMLAAGFTTAQWQTQRSASPVLEKSYGPAALIGTVQSVSAPGKNARIVLRDPAIAGLGPERTPAKLRLRVAGGIPASLKPGDRVALRAVLRPPPEPAAPGAFDFARQVYFQGIGAVGYAVSAVKPAAETTADTTADTTSGAAGNPERTNRLLASWQTFWAGWRQEVARRVLEVLPGGAGGIAAALMTGERGAIPAATIDAMRDSGLAHLLAISGLHMGLVAGWLFVGLRAALALLPPLALRYPIKKWSALAAMVGGGAYLLLVGATVPAQRAYVMVLLVLLAVLLDRTAISLRLVAWAALVILAIAPQSLLGASFQMSFAAVACLVASYEVVVRRGWLRAGGGGGFAPTGAGGAWSRRAAIYLASVLLTSVIAIIATAPFAIYHFNRMAWFGLAANLVAVPLTAFWIMPLALVAFLLMPLGLEEIALHPMGWGVAGVIRVAETVSGWPGSVSTVAALSPAGLALIVAGGLWLCIWRRPWRLAGLALVAAGLLSLTVSRPPDVLVSGDAKLFGVRDEGGELWVSSGRTGRYTADIWARRAGVAAARVWSLDPPPGAVPQALGQLSCDRLGCLFRSRGQLVALVNDARALAEDCASASLVIALVPVPRGACPGPQMVIDRFDLWRNGAYAVWLSPDSLRVRGVRQTRGERPWVRKPENGTRDARSSAR